MHFSKYIDIIENGNEVILCNTLTKELVTIESDKVRDKCELSESIEDDEKAYLFENGFIHGDLEGYKQNSINLRRDLVTLTVNITENCNLACTYCYQNDFVSKNVISDHTIGNIIRYISDIIRLGEKRIYVYFFGGEPLLYKNKILEIKSLIDRLIAVKPVEVSYGIGTNAYLLSQDFINHFESLNIDTTLTSKRDHDKFRPLKNGTGTYDKTLENLKMASKSGRVRIHIGYNASDRNTEEFGAFLSEIRRNEIVAHVSCYYINNYEFNENYLNELPYETYLKWASSKAIDQLIENGFEINASPFVSYKFECDAYNPWSVKFFSDGTIGLCNATNFYDRRVVRKLSKSSSFAENVQYSLRDKKGVLPKENPHCDSCGLIAVCRGKVDCDNSCNPNHSVDRQTFIRSLVKHIEQGNRKFFTQL